MDIILIAGLWLPATAWSLVSAELETLGHRPVPVSLPGVDDGAAGATLDDQLTAVLAAVDTADRPLIVGHSAACTLAWMAADRRPGQAAGVVFVGGFPSPSGEAYADFFPISDGVMGFPGWEAFETADVADLDEKHRAAFVAQAVPVPAGVAMARVRLNDDRRFRLPVVVVCPEFSADQAGVWVGGGDVPELNRANDVAFIDIDSGHWPMITRPGELSQLLAGAADDIGASGRFRRGET